MAGFYYSDEPLAIEKTYEYLIWKGWLTTTNISNHHCCVQVCSTAGGDWDWCKAEGYSECPGIEVDKTFGNLSAPAQFFRTEKQNYILLGCSWQLWLANLRYPAKIVFRWFASMAKKQTKLPVELVSRAIYHRITIMRQSRIESHHIPTILPIFHIPIIFPSYSIRVLNLPICLMGWIWLNHVESHFDTAHSPFKKSFEEGVEATSARWWHLSLHRVPEWRDEFPRPQVVRCREMPRIPGKVKTPPCKIQNGWDLLIFVTGFDQRL
jgi:hypothetical protein